MSTEPTPPPPPPASKPQLPPASKPTLPQAPKLSLAGNKSSFKPEPSADPFATETARPQPAAAPATPSAAALPRPPAIGGGTAPSATKAPIPSANAPGTAHAPLIPLDEDAPKWAGIAGGLAAAVAVAACVLSFLELKPTL